MFREISQVTPISRRQELSERDPALKRIELQRRMHFQEQFGRRSPQSTEQVFHYLILLRDQLAVAIEMHGRLAGMPADIGEVARLEQEWNGPARATPEIVVSGVGQPLIEPAQFAHELRPERYVGEIPRYASENEENQVRVARLDQ